MKQLEKRAPFMFCAHKKTTRDSQAPEKNPYMIAKTTKSATEVTPSMAKLRTPHTAPTKSVVFATPTYFVPNPGRIRPAIEATLRMDIWYVHKEAE